MRFTYNELLLDVAADNKDLLAIMAGWQRKHCVAMFCQSGKWMIEMRHWAKEQQLTELWRQNYIICMRPYLDRTDNASLYQDAIIRQLSAEDA